MQIMHADNHMQIMIAYNTIHLTSKVAETIYVVSAD